MRLYNRQPATDMLACPLNVFFTVTATVGYGWADTNPCAGRELRPERWYARKISRGDSGGECSGIKGENVGE